MKMFSVLLCMYYHGGDGGCSRSGIGMQNECLVGVKWMVCAIYIVVSIVWMEKMTLWYSVWYNLLQHKILLCQIIIKNIYCSIIIFVELLFILFYFFHFILYVLGRSHCVFLYNTRHFRENTTIHDEYEMKRCTFVGFWIMSVCVLQNWAAVQAESQLDQWSQSFQVLSKKFIHLGF